MSKTNENTDGTNLKIYSPMGHFLNWKLQLCFRPVPKIPIGTITLSHVMHLWLYSLYLHRWRSVYVGIVILFFFAVILLMSEIFLFTLQNQTLWSSWEREIVNIERCQHALLAWTPQHSVIKSHSGWRWFPFSCCAVQSEWVQCLSTSVQILKLPKRVKEKEGKGGGGKYA